MSYSAEVLTDIPLIYWRLGEPSGTTAVDASGNGNDGTYIGGPTLGATGLIDDADTAATFPNTGGTDIQVQSASWPSGPVPLTSGFTFECLVNINDPRHAYGFGSIMAIWGSGFAEDLEISITANGADDGLGYWLKTTAGDHDGYNVFSPIVPGTTYHVALTWDTTTVNFYVDGTLIDSQAHGGTLTIASGNPLRAGNNGFGAGDGSNGTIDEVAFYDQALSGARVLAHYDATTNPDATVPASVVASAVTVPNAFVNATVVSPDVVGATISVPAPTLQTSVTLTPSVVATTASVRNASLLPYPDEVMSDVPFLYWRCGDVASPITDSSGSGYDAVGLVDAQYNVPRLQRSDSNGAVRLVLALFSLETSHNFQVVDFPTNFFTGGAFTFEMLIRLEGFDDGLLCGFTGNGINIDAAGNIYASFNESGTLTFHQGGSHPLNLQRTYHLAATFDGTSGDLKLYVNGVNVDTFATAASGFSLTGDPEPFRTAVAFNALLTATVDEVAWYQTALSASRILNHYEAANIDPTATITVSPSPVTSLATIPTLGHLPDPNISPQTVAATAHVYRARVNQTGPLFRSNSTSFIPMR